MCFVLAHVPKEVPGWLHVTAVILAHGNSAVNPVLYGFGNENFRQGYRAVLGCGNRQVGGAGAVAGAVAAPKSGLGTDSLAMPVLSNTQTAHEITLGRDRFSGTHLPKGGAG